MAGADEGETQADEAVGPAQWVDAWRGFAALFWGLPLAVGLFFGAVEIEPWRRVPVPPYVIGVAVIGAGGVWLWRARLPGPPWRSSVRDLLVAAGLLVYFAPLVRWYSFMSVTGWHFILNAAALLGAVIGLVWTANRLAGHAGLIAGDGLMAAECFLCGWMAAGMVLIPVILASAFGAYLAVQHQTSLAAQIEIAQQQPSVWVPAFVLMPLSLTMVSVWKAKERCARSLAGAGAAGSSPAARTPSRKS